MSVALGPIRTHGGIRFAVLSQSRVTSLPWPGCAMINASKTPVCVLFEQNGRRWAQSVDGQGIPVAEVAARYPQAWRAFGSTP